MKLLNQSINQEIKIKFSIIEYIYVFNNRNNTLDSLYFNDTIFFIYTVSLNHHIA